MLKAHSAQEKRLRRRVAIEALIEQAIEALDALDGDTDLEPDSDDCCEAHDDDMGYRCAANGIGDDTDAEPDDEDLGAQEDEFPCLSPAATAWVDRNGPAHTPYWPTPGKGVPEVRGVLTDPSGRPGKWVAVR